MVHTPEQEVAVMRPISWLKKKKKKKTDIKVLHILKMVRVCVSWSPYRFHRVPVSDAGLRQRWLLELNMDISSPLQP